MARRTTEKPLPKTVYVAWDELGSEEPYLVLADKPEDHAELHKQRKVGIYVLDKVIIVDGTPTIK